MTHVEIILQEMFRRVGDEYTPDKTKKEGWYWDHEWTRQEEKSFEDWLTKYLYIHKNARIELMMARAKDKERCKKVASWFVMDYGWKIKRTK